MSLDIATTPKGNLDGSTPKVKPNARPAGKKARIQRRCFGAVKVSTIVSGVASLLKISLYFL